MLGGKGCTIGAISKGSGMIHPNMATMLCFITTDVAISTPMLQKALSAAVADSFNTVHVAEGSDGGVDAAGDDGARAGEELGGLIHVLREAKRANLEKGLPSLKWVLFPNQY